MQTQDYNPVYQPLTSLPGQYTTTFTYPLSQSLFAPPPVPQESNHDLSNQVSKLNSEIDKLRKNNQDLKDLIRGAIGSLKAAVVVLVVLSSLAFFAAAPGTLILGSLALFLGCCALKPLSQALRQPRDRLEIQ